MMIKKYTGHGYDVLDVASSCDNSQLASCGSDKTVIYWDVGTGQVWSSRVCHSICIEIRVFKLFA